MEAITNAAEDYLIDGLSFKMAPGASYVTDRKSSTFWSVGSNAYTPTGGVKLLKFQLTGDDGNWLDPSSVVIQFELLNTATPVGTAGEPVLRPVGQPHLFFKRLRVLAGGQVVEDIQDFGRNSELIASLQNEFVRDNNDIQGFGARFDSSRVQAMEDLRVVDPTNLTSPELLAGIRTYLPQIKAGKSKIVNFRPLCGLLNQDKFLPLKFVPIVLELELGDATDAVVTSQTYNVNTNYDTIYTTGNTSNSWQIQNACVKCDICTLDNALNNSYIEHLLSGKSLPIQYSTYISQQSAVVGKSFAVQVVRAVSKLQKAFISFYSDSALPLPFRKPTITFHHPMDEMSPSAFYDPDKEIQIYLQLGSKLYPEYPTTNLSECFYRLKETLNLPDHHQHAISIKFQHYIRNKFIYGVSFEKIADASWTGVNTKAGQVLMVNAKAVNEAGITQSNIATTMFTLLQAEQILEIRDVGCTVYD